MASVRHDSVTVHVDAPPEAVWEVLADAERMGQLSPECIRVSWLHGAGAPATVGAEFKGHNKAGIGGLMRWSFRCRITKAEPARELEWATMRGKRQVTLWRYVMTGAGGGTDVTESFDAVWWPADVRFFEDVVMRDRNERRRQAMRATLQGIKRAVERRT